MKKKVAAFIHQNRLFTKKDKLLIAVSGGLDSVVLAVILKKLGYSFQLAHVNYNLRAEDSVKDREFVENLATELDVKLHVLEFKLKKKDSGSIQQRAREIRYSWMQDILKKNELDFILTGHHADDSVETVLLNFLRGAGPDGLRGIPHTRDQIRRPFLSLHKAEIEDYAKKKDINWREDYTNQGIDYNRNYLRNEIIPRLETNWPGFKKTVLTNAGIQSECREIVAFWADREKQNLVREVENNRLWIIQLDEVKNSISPVTLLHEIFKDIDLNREIYSEIIKSDQAGKEWYSSDKTYRILTEPGGVLSLEKFTEKQIHPLIIEEGQGKISHPSGTLTVKEVGGAKITDNPNKAYLRPDRLVFPLEIRPWRPGDIFHPLGMMGNRKKLKNFLSDRKLGKRQKEKVVVLTSGGEICWVVGLRIDERFGVKKSDRDKNCYYLHWSPSRKEN